MWLKLGVGLSSTYMLLTIGNKIYINSVYKKSLQTEGINYIRYRTQPSIFNNVLWYGIAETETAYYVGFFGLLDKQSKIEKWHQLPKNHNLAPVSNIDINTLAWFSDQYYNFIPEEEGVLRYNDLRYPSFDFENPNNSVFSFSIKKQGGRWNVLPFEGKPPSKEMFNNFWNRIKGN